MPLYKTNGICLKSINIGEADKLVTFYSRELGKIKAVAKGARRTSSKFGGRLEPFTYNNLLLATGKSLDIVSQCETIETFYKLREDQNKLLTGIYFIKLLDLTTEERHENERLFDLLLKTLYLLDKSNNKNLLARYFEVRLVDIEGIFPDLEKLHSSEKLKDAIFSLKEGSLMVDLDKKELKDIEKLFRRMISEHIDRDLSKLKLGVF